MSGGDAAKPDSQAVTAANAFIAKLRTKSDEKRIEAAQQLFDYMNGELRDNTEKFNRDFTNALYKDPPIVDQLIGQSNDNNDRKAGIFLIACLVDIKDVEETRRIPRFSKLLVTAMQYGDEATAELAARAYAFILLTSKTYANELVEDALSKTCEWLEEKDSKMDRRLPAVLLLRQLAWHTQSAFFQRADRFFSSILRAIRDPRVNVRLASARALGAAMTVTSQREAKQKVEWYKSCYDEACICGRDESRAHRDERIHAMLLLLNEVVRIANGNFERSRAQALVQSNSEESDLTTDNLIRWLTSEHIRTSIVESHTAQHLVRENINQIVALARDIGPQSKVVYSQTAMLDLYGRLTAFEEAVPAIPLFLEQALSIAARNPSPAFACIGLIVLRRPEVALTKIEPIVALIATMIPIVPPNKRKPVEPNVFVCLRLLVRSLGSAIELEMKSLLPALLATGLSFGLTTVLQEINETLEGLKTEVQDGLLDQLSLVLRNCPLPSKLAPPGPPISKELALSSAQAAATANLPLVVLALNTLGQFRFQRHALQIFREHVTYGYLMCEQIEARLAGVDCCLRMLLPFIRLFEKGDDKQKKTVLPLIKQVLSKLAGVAISDPEEIVRLRVLRCFLTTEGEAGKLLSIHLAQSEMLNLLMNCLQDERYDVELAAVDLLGKLAHVNPALVVPRLRRLLMETVTRLCVGGSARLELHSARILTHLATDFPQFLRPYIGELLDALRPKLQIDQPHLDVTVAALLAVAELATVGGGDLVRALAWLFPPLIHFLQDSSSLQRREASLRALGRLCQRTCYVVEPYKDHPELLDVLLRLLRTEQAGHMRRLTMRVLGIVGALDPFMHREFVATQPLDSTAALAMSMPIAAKPAPSLTTESDTQQEIIQWYNYERCTLDEFYPWITVATLVQLLGDAANRDKHKDATAAVVTVLISGGSRSTHLLDQVIPRLIGVIGQSAAGMERKFYLEQMTRLIASVGTGIKPYLAVIFQLLRRIWEEDESSRLMVLRVLRHLAEMVDLTAYVSEVCPYVLRALATVGGEVGSTVTVISDLRAVTSLCREALNCVTAFGEAGLGSHMHLLLPSVLQIIDRLAASIELRLAAIETMHRLVERLPLLEQAPRIMQVWMRNVNFPSLQDALMKFLYVFIAKLGVHFFTFYEVVENVLTKNNIPRGDYYKLIQGLEIGMPPAKALPTMTIPQIVLPNRDMRASQALSGRGEHKERMNLDVLKDAWTVKPHLSSREDWSGWLKRLRVTFIRQSPAPALRSCGELSDAHTPLERDLFNAAFMSCWTELTEQDQNNVTAQLIEALKTSNDTEIVQTILNLAEFMDHSERGPLPISFEMLSERAQVTRAFAKALRYKEEEVRKKMQKGEPVLPTDCEALITLANKLNVEEAAAGVVVWAEGRKMNIEMKGRWYEKLHEWEKALAMYAAELEQETSGDHDEEDNSNLHNDLIVHQMRCLEALAQWTPLNDLAKQQWQRSNAPRQKMAVIAANGAWAAEDWPALESYVKVVNENTQDGTLLRSVVAIRQERYQDAINYIEKFRDTFDAELTAQAGESYERAYGAMIRVQQLTELEEVVECMQQPGERQRIAILWARRLSAIRRNVDHWQKLLHVRQLLLNKQEMQPLWIKFASLCRKHNKTTLAHRVLCQQLKSLGAKEFARVEAMTPLSSVPLPLERPRLAFAICKQLWHERSTDYSIPISYLHQLANYLDRQARSASLAQHPDEHRRLTAKTFITLGQWHEASAIDATMVQSLAVALEHYKAACEHDPKWYKAWHSLATAHYKIVVRGKNAAAILAGGHHHSHHFGLMASPIPMGLGMAPISPIGMPISPIGMPITDENDAFIERHASEAVKCFLQAMCLAEGNRIQDTLRLLTLWFDHGHRKEIFERLRDGIRQVPLNMWLEVIPQLMARLDSQKQVATLIKHLVVDIGKQHPQALVYPLTVAAKSQILDRKNVAIELLAAVAEHRPKLVEQAKLVSDELIRAAILWHEQWQEALDEASRAYFQEKNIRLMFDILEPMHAMIERPPQTLKEQSFNQTYFTELTDAKNFCNNYKRTSNGKELTSAWDLYYTVFKKIVAQLKQLTMLDLNYVSPALVAAQGLELAVPGTYDPDRPLITIASVGHQLQVITSKQRPRKITIRGSNGQEYAFLLKGHEDPRQDERVMQLFGLVNTLLVQQSDTCRRNLTIQRYSIIPLSHNSGLIGWVPNCDTLHALIRDYRDKKKVLLSFEHKLMQHMTQDLEMLTLMQKVQVFEHALQVTEGDDLAQILWLKSPNSESWFDRRTNYTRSMACMSMVGYILGLGDRHPSNLMLDRITGKIVHIDFGDCFEVAMTREKFPERIPFRLTRMLVNAMEVSGVEGNFRITCERVMRVLRMNHDSLLAVLEAFVHDPLINWRLLDVARRGPTDITQSSFRSTMGELPMNISSQPVFMDSIANEKITNRAIAVIDRIRMKLAGREFMTIHEYSISDQVRLLIEHATSHENLCQCYIGWCPFW